MRIAAYVTGLVVAFLAGVGLMMLARLVVEDDGGILVWVRGDDCHGN